MIASNSASSSPNEVSIRQATPAIRDRISRHTDTPSPSGSRTSRTATSGRSASIRASADDADPASPTTRISGSASSRSRTPRRPTSWSFEKEHRDRLPGRAGGRSTAHRAYYGNSRHSVPPPGGHGRPGSLGQPQLRHSAWGRYGPRSLASGTYGTLAPGPDAYRPARPGSGFRSRYAGWKRGVLPEPAGGYCDSRNPSSPPATAGQPPRSSCMVHAHAKTGLDNPSVTRSGSRFGAGARTGIQGGYGTGESSGRGDKGQGGRSPGVVRGGSHAGRHADIRPSRFSHLPNNRERRDRGHGHERVRKPMRVATGHKVAAPAQRRKAPRGRRFAREWRNPARRLGLDQRCCYCRYPW